MLERIRARPDGSPLDAQDRVTFSAGIVSTVAPGLETVDAYIARANARLYIAKVSHDAVVSADIAA